MRLELNLAAKPKPSAVAAAAAYLPLQVGKIYVMANGKHTISVNPHSGAHNMVRIRWSDGGTGSYWKDTGRYIWADKTPGDGRHIVGEHVELSPFDKMVAAWLTGKNVRYRTPEGEAWHLFPKATACANPEKFIKGYEKQFVWEDLQ